MSTPPVGCGDTHVRMVVGHAFADGCTGWETGFIIELDSRARQSKGSSIPHWLAGTTPGTYPSRLLRNTARKLLAGCSCCFLLPLLVVHLLQLRPLRRCVIRCCLEPLFLTAVHKLVPSREPVVKCACAVRWRWCDGE